MVTRRPVYNRPMQVSIISIGDELTLGQTIDTNSAWIASMLIRHGISVARHLTLSDDHARIVRAVRQEAIDCDWVLITGGLGPTDDDLTREALAEACGAPLVPDPRALESLERFFARRNRPMPERNRKQALIPQGHEMLENPNGTAPGLLVTVGACSVAAMPGVPAEMKPMFTNLLLPRIMSEQPGGRQFILTRTVHTFGWGESDVGQRLGELMDRSRNPRVGTTVSQGLVTVRIRSEFAEESVASQQLDDTTRQVADRLHPMVFGTDEQTLEGSVVDLLRQHQLRLVTAESCTGGGLGRAITEVPGSSEVFLGGWMVYSNPMKINQLGVDPALIDTHGAVSSQVAAALAEGALAQSQADIAVSITGIAGPDGGTPDKPVGTIWLGMARKYADGSADVQTIELRLGHDRAVNRDRTVKSALQLIRLTLLDQPWTLLTWGHRHEPERRPRPENSPTPA